MLRGAAGIGAAGLAAGMLARVEAAPARAATAKAATDDARNAAHSEPLIVHIHNASTGVVDVYSGEQHVRLTDRQLAARLARAIS
jgi:hypothetical protein